MPSDERISAALAATAGLRERYRAAVGAAAEQIGAYLDARRARSGDVAEAALAGLGVFARGRLDGARFAALVGGPRTLAPELAAVAERAEATLEALLARGDALFSVDVPSGGAPRAAVHDALAEAGRAFGAALVFQAVKAGVYGPEQHYRLLSEFPFARWNRTERLLAPPLVVTLDGADVHAEALSEFLDGRQKILLVLRGTSTPAPLVRLVTPGTFVAQVPGPEELARAAAFDGPAVVAFVPDGAARFVHDPAAGASLGGRLTVQWLPTEAPRAALGGRSAAQQREELGQLATLAELARPPVIPAEAGIQASDVSLDSRLRGDDVVGQAADGATAVDALTNWLLTQAGFGAGEVRQS